MENLNIQGLHELNKEDLILTNGGTKVGFWPAFLLSVIIDIIDNPDSFKSGFNDFACD